MEAKISIARSGFLPFSHALIMELYVITFGCTCFKNQSKATFLMQMDIENMIFMKKTSRFIPEKLIFDINFSHFMILFVILSHRTLRKTISVKK